MGEAMSYCKGAVYLYRNGNFYVCHDCKLFNSGRVATPVFDSSLEAIDHLREHLRAGHDIPASAFVRLWGEIMRNKEKVVGK
jgi:hypothetical protein